MKLEDEALQELDFVVAHHTLARLRQATLLLLAELGLLCVQPGIRENVHSASKNFVEFKPIPLL